MATTLCQECVHILTNLGPLNGLTRSIKVKKSHFVLFEFCKTTFEETAFDFVGHE